MMYTTEKEGRALAEWHARLMEAVANAVRLKLLYAMRSKEVSVGGLCEIVGLSQSAVSQHLSKLRVKGLVAIRRDRQTIFYRLNSREIEIILSTLENLS